MDIFGIGGPELLVLLFLAGVLLGPKRVVELARQMGRTVSQVRTLTHGLTKELNREIDLLGQEERNAGDGGASRTTDAGGAGSSKGEERPKELPEAYQRFRRDFPDEGKLEEHPASPRRSESPSGGS